MVTQVVDYQCIADHSILYFQSPHLMQYNFAAYYLKRNQQIIGDVYIETSIKSANSYTHPSFLAIK